MAGIGFRIENILKDDSYIASAKAHFYSALISAGPWLLSILSLFLLTVLAPEEIRNGHIIFFRTVIIYIYAFSLIALGAFYLSLSRFLADKIYIKEEHALIPTFNAAFLLVVIFQSVTGWLLSLSLDISLVTRVMIVMNYVTISSIWLVMIFLTALRDYKPISYAYLIGSIITVVCSIMLGRSFGIAGYFVGYLFGHLCILFMLIFRIMIEFNSNKVTEWSFWTYMTHNMDLVLIGIIYNTAIWIDKFIMWYADGSYAIADVLRTNPFYDSSVFLAYLTMIPALSLFLIRIETDFYRKYRTFYFVVLNKGTLREIVTAKNEMARSLKNSINTVMVYQGMFSLLVITLAEKLLPFFRMELAQVPLFRIAVLGAFLHSLILSGIIIILYFNFRKSALWISLVFLISNAFFTLIASKLGFQYQGYGYFFSTFITLGMVYYIFTMKYRKIEYYTFALQPVGTHRQEEIA